MIVPWYDTVPQIGAVLFVAGWLAGPRGATRGRRVLRPIRPLSRPGAMGVCGLLAVLIVLNRPRVDLLWRSSVPPLLPRARIRCSRSSRCSRCGRRAAARSGRVAEAASPPARPGPGGRRRLGIGQDAVKRPSAGLTCPSFPNVYDAVDLLDLPERGRPVDPDVVRRALAPYVFKETEPRPPGSRLASPGRRRPEPDWTSLEVDAEIEPR